MGILIHFRSAYVTQFSINTNQDHFFHMFPRLHCNLLFDTGVTEALQRSIRKQKASLSCFYFIIHKKNISIDYPKSM